MTVDLTAVLNEHRANVGFREGPNNANPWGPEQGISNASYCDSYASMVPYHNGARWWPESQFGEKGSGYCPFHISVGANHGAVTYDHASTGSPAPVRQGDLLFYDWNNDGVADHVETAIEDSFSGRTHNIGANTGSPEGVYDLWRDRQYLLCALRPPFYAATTGGTAPMVTPRRGADSYGPIRGAAAKAAGYGFWFRYVEPGGRPDKWLTAAEVADAFANGIDIGLNFEADINDALAGYQGGAQRAKATNDVLDRLGAPRGLDIYVSIDTGATADQVRPYYQGWNTDPRRKVSGYGGTEIRQMKREGLCRRWWQANAGSWSDQRASNFVTDPEADVRQFVGVAHPIAGANIDENEQVSADCGFWLAPNSTNPTGGFLMALTDAQQLDVLNAMGRIEQMSNNMQAVLDAVNKMIAAGTLPGPGESNAAVPGTPYTLDQIASAVAAKLASGKLTF